jgi:hypothetical protein
MKGKTGNSGGEKETWGLKEKLSHILMCTRPARPVVHFTLYYLFSNYFAHVLVSNQEKLFQLPLILSLLTLLVSNQEKLFQLASSTEFPRTENGNVSEFLSLSCMFSNFFSFSFLF